MKFNNRNVIIGKDVSLGKGARIGDNTVIYDHVVIEDGAIIANNCVIGEPSNDYYYNETYENKTTIIGSNSLIRSHTIIYNGNKIGSNVKTGHHVILRENNEVGANCSIGNFCQLHGNVRMGKYVRLHSVVCVVENAVIGDFVWLSPGTVFANDPTPPSNHLISPEIGDYSFIAINCALMPGVKIGKHCMVGPATLVSKDVPDHCFAIGNPCRILTDINKFSGREINHYPWPYNFERGMPWEGIGYEAWLKNNMDQD
jgi:acetyltransferase-like isoleucine patch superfamily enzyme